ESANEIGMLLAVSERAEHPVGELADVALRPAEDEAVGAQILEHRDRPIAAQRATENDRLFRLEEREVRAGGASLRTAGPHREALVAGRADKTGAQPVGVSARVD